MSKGQKQFSNNFVGGYNKTEVTAYLESLIKQYNAKIQQKDNEINELNKQINELKSENSSLNSEIKAREGEKEKIALTLLLAQDKSNQIMEEARISAISEKQKLDIESEALREVIFERKNLIRDIRLSVDNFGKEVNEIITEKLAQINQEIYDATSSIDKKFLEKYAPRESYTEPANTSESYETVSEISETSNEPSEDIQPEVESEG